MKFNSLAIFLSLAAATNAHFQLQFPTSRGDNEETQGTGPCGGRDTPSATRTPWPLTGGVLKFEAGHDEADTAVYLALGNNPSARDFDITLAPQFLQTGLGTFCWNSLDIPAGTAGIADGVNATIQVVQAGHSGGGLYNCADITFVTEPTFMTTDCANSTGIGAESIDSASPPPSTTNGTPPTTTGAPSETTSNAASRLTGGVAAAAGIAAMFGLVL